MSRNIVVPRAPLQRNLQRDHEQRVMVPLVVVGLLWSLVVSQPVYHEHLDRADRSIPSLDWGAVASRARAAQSPTISSSPAR